MNSMILLVSSCVGFVLSLVLSVLKHQGWKTIISTVFSVVLINVVLYFTLFIYYEVNWYVNFIRFTLVGLVVVTPVMMYYKIGNKDTIRIIVTSIFYVTVVANLTGDAFITPLLSSNIMPYGDYQLEVIISLVIRVLFAGIFFLFFKLISKYKTQTVYLIFITLIMLSSVNRYTSTWTSYYDLESVEPTYNILPRDSFEIIDELPLPYFSHVYAYEDGVMYIYVINTVKNKYAFYRYDYINDEFYFDGDIAEIDEPGTTKVVYYDGYTYMGNGDIITSLHEGTAKTVFVDNTSSYLQFGYLNSLIENGQLYFYIGDGRYLVDGDQLKDYEITYYDPWDIGFNGGYIGSVDNKLLGYTDDAFYYDGYYYDFEFYRYNLYTQYGYLCRGYICLKEGEQYTIGSIIYQDDTYYELRGNEVFELFSDEKISTIESRYAYHQSIEGLEGFLVYDEIYSDFKLAKISFDGTLHIENDVRGFYSDINYGFMLFFMIICAVVPLFKIEKRS